MIKPVGDWIINFSFIKAVSPVDRDSYTALTSDGRQMKFSEEEEMPRKEFVSIWLQANNQVSNNFYAEVFFNEVSMKERLKAAMDKSDEAVNDLIIDVFRQVEDAINKKDWIEAKSRVKDWVGLAKILHDLFSSNIEAEYEAKKGVSTAERVIKLLDDRNGFDRWWEEIDEEVQDEIVKEIAGVVKR